MLSPAGGEAKLCVKFWMECCFQELVVEIGASGWVVRLLWIVPVIDANLDFL